MTPVGHRVVSGGSPSREGALVSYVIVATYRAEKGQGDGVAAHLRAMRNPTRAEAGCLSYDVYASREDDRTFVLVEVYRDEESFQAHASAPYFDEHIRHGAWPLLEERTVVRAGPLDE